MRLRWVAVCSVLPVGLVHAQIGQLATNGNGSTLLVQTGFRLQTETDLHNQAKIYQFQNGQWTRLAVANDNFSISPPDVFNPFISTDGTVIGWQIANGCGFCRFIVTPLETSTVTGVTLPPRFPLGTLQMSANGRYFTGDNYPFANAAFPGPQYVDLATGTVTDVPVDVNTRPVVREPANDGTVLLRLTAKDDPGQNQSVGTLALWRPGSDPKPIYSDNRVFDPAISAAGGRVAFEAVVDGGPNADQRTLIVIDTNTGESISVASLPPANFRAFPASFSMPAWDVNGDRLVYRAFDDRGQPSAISVWDAGSRQSSVVLTSEEGFSSAVISGDGNVIWAVTQTNRLLRFNFSTGATDEILPPLGRVTFGVDAAVVPGSAALIRGSGFTRSQVVLDAGVALPIVDIVPEGLWVQIPWEDSGAPQATHTVTIRSDGNPFEAVTNVTVDPQIHPHFAKWTDTVTSIVYVKAVHEDFQSLVTPANPARRGEIVHVYLTGLGPLDQNLPTGAAGPVNPLAHPTTPFHFTLGSGISPPLVLTGLSFAPGLIGIYQADVTIPNDVLDGRPLLYCFTDAGPQTVDAVALPTTSSSQ